MITSVVATMSCHACVRNIAQRADALEPAFLLATVASPALAVATIIGARAGRVLVLAEEDGASLENQSRERSVLDPARNDVAVGLAVCRMPVSSSPLDRCSRAVVR